MAEIYRASVRVRARDPGGTKRSRTSLGLNVPVLVFGIAVLTSLTVVVRSPWLATATAALIGLMVSPLVGRRVRHLHVSLTGPSSFVAGEPAQLTMTIINRSASPCPAFGVEIVPPGMTGFAVLVEGLAGRGQHIETFTVHPGLRHGPTTVRANVTSWDALMLVVRRTWVDARFTASVHPPRVPAPTVATTAAADMPRQRAITGNGDDFGGVRPWRRGDNRRAIHWRSTARRSQLVVVERLRPQAEGIAVVVVGEAQSVTDELMLASAAALGTKRVADREPLHVIGFTRDGVSMAPTTSARLLSAWLCQPGFVTPSAAQIDAALPAAVGTVAVAVTESVPSAWRDRLAATLRASHRDVVWLQPGTLGAERHALMTNLVTRRDAWRQAAKVALP